MRALRAPLSPKEENTLRRIGNGDIGGSDPVAIRRLHQLGLIEWLDESWRLTELGRLRHARLSSDRRPA